MNEQILYNRPTFPAQLDMSHPLTRGLQACWALNEDSPKSLRVWDSSPYRNHLTATGTRARHGGRLFNGVDEDCRISNPAFFKNTKGTFEIWCKQEVQGNILAAAGNGAGTQELQVSAALTSTSELVLLNPGISVDLVFANGTVPINRYNQIIWTSDSSLIRGFANGVKQTLTVVSGSNTGQWFNSTTANVFTLGGVMRATLTGDYNGTILLCRIWNIPLADKQIFSLFSNPYEMFLS